MHRLLLIVLGLVTSTVVFIAPAAAANDMDSCQTGDFKDRISACTRAIDSRKFKGEELAILYAERGQAFEHADDNNRDRAIADYTQALRIRPKDDIFAHFSVYTFRGQAFRSKGQLDRAIEDFTRSITVDYPSHNRNREAYFERARTHELKGDLDRAIADYNYLIPFVQNELRPHYQRGLLYDKKGDLDRAIADYTDAIWFNDKHMAAYVARALAYQKKGDVARAKKDFQSARTSNDLHEGEHVYDIAERALRALGESPTQPAIAAAPEAAAKTSPAKTSPASSSPANSSPSPAAASQPADVAPPAPAAAQPVASGSQIAPPPVVQAPEPKVAIATPAAKVDPAVTPPPVSAPIAAETRVALVIGNGNYRAVAKLQNPPRDAAALAQTLRRVGFKTVQVSSDLSREGMIAALRNFEREAERADWAVVYFAGHGIEVGGVNYLVPVDAQLKTDKDAQDEALPLERVLSAIESARKLKLVILDACRDNPFAASMKRSIASRSVGRGLARIEPEGGVLVAYAAKHGQIALDGEGSNSPFVTALVKRLDTPGLDISLLFRLVRDDVLAATGRQQEPFVYGSLPGEVLSFRPK